jgi:nucleotide-binding universal stress UspA family protein
MTIFPTRILFASDASEDSELAATTAVALANITGSELHVLHVAPAFPDYFEPSDPDEPGPTEREGRRILDEQLNKIENVGGTVAQSHLRRGVPLKRL